MRLGCVFADAQDFSNLLVGESLNVVQYEAAAGTVTVEIEVPRIEGEVPLSANRGGAVEVREPVAD